MSTRDFLVNTRAFEGFDPFQVSAKWSTMGLLKIPKDTILSLLARGFRRLCSEMIFEHASVAARTMDRSAYEHDKPGKQQLFGVKSRSQNTHSSQQLHFSPVWSHFDAYESNKKVWALEPHIRTFRIRCRMTTTTSCALQLGELLTGNDFPVAHLEPGLSSQAGKPH